MALRQRRRIEMYSLRLDRAAAMLVSPAQRVRQQRERLMANNMRLARAMTLLRERQEGRLGQVCARLGRIQPDTERARRALEQCAARLADRKSTRLNSSHYCASRMPSS